jgi:phosphopantothenoylcysteine decarboxylase/phosphopantothenate--cysteine ligase
MASDSASSPLAKRQIIVGVCGGIAAYKSADLVSKLVQSGAGVTVCMTNDAQKFVQPLTFEALSGKKVRTEIFDLADSSDPQHIALTEQSDLFIIAPATAHTIAKIAHGFCDDIISLLAIAAACPILLAPAMNNHMWENPIAQENVKKLSANKNYHLIGPDEGWLACRNTGPGRMSEPTKILEEAQRLLNK